MLKPTFQNILLYLFVKYLAFYVFLMFKNADFRLLEIGNVKRGHSITYFLLVMLPLPVISMILFSVPIYYSFKLKNIFLFILLIGGILVSEYFVYVFFTSERHIDMNGIYNGVLSLLFFILFFVKHSSLMFRQKEYGNRTHSKV
jgi:hypothetical protein